MGRSIAIGRGSGSGSGIGKGIGRTSGSGIGRGIGRTSGSGVQALKEAEKQKQRLERELARTGFGGKKALTTAASIMHKFIGITPSKAEVHDPAAAGGVGGSGTAVTPPSCPLEGKQQRQQQQQQQQHGLLRGSALLRASKSPDPALFMPGGSPEHVERDIQLRRLRLDPLLSTGLSGASSPTSHLNQLKVELKESIARSRQLVTQHTVPLGSNVGNALSVGSGHGSMSSGSYRRGRQLGVPLTWARRPGCSLDPAMHVAKYYGEGADWSNIKSWRRKLLSFANCNRPAFYGSFSKISTVVRGRRPLALDKVHLDYEVDSDEEWEEEPEGEDIGDGDDGMDEDDVEAVEDGDEAAGDGFFVDDGYLSEDEGVGDCSQMGDGKEDEEGGEAWQRAQAVTGPLHRSAVGVDPRLQQLQAATDRASRGNRCLVMIRDQAGTLKCDQCSGLDVQILEALKPIFLTSDLQVQKQHVGPPKDLGIYASLFTAVAACVSGTAGSTHAMTAEVSGKRQHSGVERSVGGGGTDLMKELLAVQVDASGKAIASVTAPGPEAEALGPPAKRSRKSGSATIFPEELSDHLMSYILAHGHAKLDQIVDGFQASPFGLGLSKRLIREGVKARAYYSHKAGCWQALLVVRSSGTASLSEPVLDVHLAMRETDLKLAPYVQGVDGYNNQQDVDGYNNQQGSYQPHYTVDGPSRVACLAIQLESEAAVSRGIISSDPMAVSALHSVCAQVQTTIPTPAHSLALHSKHIAPSSAACTHIKENGSLTAVSLTPSISKFFQAKASKVTPALAGASEVPTLSTLNSPPASFPPDQHTCVDNSVCSTASVRTKTPHSSATCPESQPAGASTPVTPINAAAGCSPLPMGSARTDAVRSVAGTADASAPLFSARWCGTPHNTPDVRVTNIDGRSSVDPQNASAYKLLTAAAAAMAARQLGAPSACHTTAEVTSELEHSKVMKLLREKDDDDDHGKGVSSVLQASQTVLDEVIAIPFPVDSSELKQTGSGHLYWQALQEWLAQAYIPATHDVVAALAVFRSPDLILFVKSIPMELIKGMLKSMSGRSQSYFMKCSLMQAFWSVVACLTAPFTEDQDTWSKSEKDGQLLCTCEEDLRDQRLRGSRVCPKAVVGGKLRSWMISSSPLPVCLHELLLLKGLSSQLLAAAMYNNAAVQAADVQMSQEQQEGDMKYPAAAIQSLCALAEVAGQMRHSSGWTCSPLTDKEVYSCGTTVPLPVSEEAQALGQGCVDSHPLVGTSHPLFPAATRMGGASVGGHPKLESACEVFLAGLIEDPAWRSLNRTLGSLCKGVVKHDRDATAAAAASGDEASTQGNEAVLEKLLKTFEVMVASTTDQQRPDLALQGTVSSSRSVEACVSHEGDALVKNSVTDARRKGPLLAAPTARLTGLLVRKLVGIVKMAWRTNVVGAEEDENLAEIHTSLWTTDLSVKAMCCLKALSCCPHTAEWMLPSRHPKDVFSCHEMRASVTLLMEVVTKVFTSSCTSIRLSPGTASAAVIKSIALLLGPGLQLAHQIACAVRAQRNAAGAERAAGGRPKRQTYPGLSDMREALQDLVHTFTTCDTCKDQVVSLPSWLLTLATECVQVINDCN
ncbi:hypothetical protein CEUSTIGMA_g2044.t1 [Chlamydomonas eustigma]|uniref:Chromatin assembly factor 1 subunit A dimerization domain-containing protein n=1 Tax=Chlamydomonas eustigma TaxID=1157962 RepID=A0A250WV16_9CHLO|nr:hypothetical protein CEUSTIGMA_g2044.t1 [Chlamydomonas eustigma]|eukprot:GAX74596.1 hypothetical protein CEUSTIGMA_g2044.t1 [Chlamydomonas eustigma]